MAKVKCESAFTQFDKVNIREPRKLTVNGQEVPVINPDYFTDCTVVTYATVNSFSVTGNQVDKFQIGRQVQLDSGQSDIACNKNQADLTPDDIYTVNKFDYSIITNVEWDGVLTTVTIADSILTPNLDNVCIDINWSTRGHDVFDTIDAAQSASLGTPFKVRGFYSVFDGGAGEWEPTGNIILPNQLPVNTATATMSDNNGNEYSIVAHEKIAVKSLGALGDNDSANVALNTTTIQAAIDYTSSNQTSLVYLGSGAFWVDELIVNNNGIFIEGDGCGFLLGGISNIRASAKTRLISSTPSFCVTFTSVSGVPPKVSGGMKGVMFDLRGQSEGLALRSWRLGDFKDLFIYAPLTTGLWLGAYSGTLSSEPYDTQHNVFTNVNVDDKNIPTSNMNAAKLTGGQGDGGLNGGNSSFNYFYSCRLYSSTGSAVVLENTDNNIFYGLRAGGNGSEYAVVLTDQDTGTTTGTARFNQFHGLEAGGLGVLAMASQTGGNSSFDNKIYGWNSSNGAVAPTIQSPAGGSPEPTLEVYGEGSISGVSYQFDRVNDNSPAGETGSVLSDYSEGTFMPVVEGTTSSGTANYLSQNGKYTRIGNTVSIQVYISYNTHTGSGNMEISGLPYIQSAGNNHPILTIATQNISYSDTLVCYGLGGTDRLRLRQMTSGATTNLPMDAAGVIYITGTYQLD